MFPLSIGVQLTDSYISLNKINFLTYSMTRTERLNRKIARTALGALALLTGATGYVLNMAYHQRNVTQLTDQLNNTTAAITVYTEAERTLNSLGIPNDFPRSLNIVYPDGTKLEVPPFTRGEIQKLETEAESLRDQIRTHERKRDWIF